MPKRIDQPNSRLRVQRVPRATGKRFDVLMGQAILGALTFNNGWRWKPFTATGRPSRLDHKTPFKALQPYFRSVNARWIASEVERLDKEAGTWSKLHASLAPSETTEEDVERVWNLLSNLAEGEPFVVNGRLVIRVFDESFAVEGVGHTMNALQAARYLSHIEKGS